MESILPVHVYMEDTDCGGVVYHANFVKYFERGRSDWIYRIGYGLDRLAQEGIFFVVRNVNVDYLAPARLHDNLLVVSKVATVKRTSIIFEQYLYRDDAEKIISESLSHGRLC
ncbi:MAG: YbgC/FadM family acyl-CoA thioesterase [Coxiellaceae bacterium]|nr:MAG: YbgC/FadM family acyl-CoA thioesterase [Coxiellaceae bacterium]